MTSTSPRPVADEHTHRECCTEDACPASVLDVTLDLLDAVAGGRSPEVALCTCLADRCGADSVVQVIFGSQEGRARVLVWPDTRHATAVRAALELLAPTLAALLTEGGSEAASWQLRQTELALRRTLRCADLALVRLEGPVPRLVVLAADHPFDRYDVHVLGCLREPLGSLLRVVDPLRAGASSDEPSDPGLSVREVEVLRLVAQGLLARTVATRLHVSPRTVHKHLGSAYRKLDAHDRLAAVRRAEHLGLLSGGGSQGSSNDVLSWTLRW